MTNTNSDICRHLAISHIRGVVKRKAVFAKKNLNKGWTGETKGGDKGSVILSYLASRQSCAVNAVTLQRCQSS